jgi:hypothetical protein
LLTRELIKECSILRQCSHENIVAFKGIYWEPPPVDVRGIVMEACEVCRAISSFALIYAVSATNY